MPILTALKRLALPTELLAARYQAGPPMYVGPERFEIGESVAGSGCGKVAHTKPRAPKTLGRLILGHTSAKKLLVSTVNRASYGLAPGIKE
jgi:hypothetical protein